MSSQCPLAVRQRALLILINFMMKNPDYQVHNPDPMKNHLLYLTVKVEVESGLATLSETITEFEQNTQYCFSSTENIAVIHTELLQTETF